MSAYIAGWRIALEADTRGAPYWRAYRGPWQRGAHRPASLRELCEAAPVGTWPIRTEDVLPVKPIMKYPGAKNRDASWIVRHFPKTPFYVEPFCGSAGVWFELWERGEDWPRYTVLNDLEGEIVNVFRVLRDPEQRARLIDAVALTPWSRAEYEVNRNAPTATPHANPIERARLYLVQLWQGHGSAAGGRSVVGWRHQGIGGMRTNTMTWQGWTQLPERLASAAQALMSAEIECRPARALIREYAAPDVLIYADPPYLGSVRNGALYRHEMRGVLEHARLLRDLRRHPGPVALSGYPHPLYDRLLSGWRCVTKESQAEKGNTRTECLWLNPVLQDRMGLGPLFDWRAA